MINPLVIKVLLIMALISCFKIEALTLEQQVAQKLMIDIRYYCDEQASQDLPCKEPLLILPDELKEMITATSLGGVILFSENLKDIDQIAKLTSDLQSAAKHSQIKSPLLISIDQEGGRVARLPRHLATSFTGNMSIGATYAKYGDKFATQSAVVIAKELTALGINVNHAPDIDVNMNPDNPVINVRSFGEDATVVAKLGAAQVKAFQQQKLIATLKHFPGHGDTKVDSHTGLPLVNHDIDTIEKNDLLPFKYIIEKNPPGMIMTAHIQYPALDSSTFTAKNGDRMIKPATMSHKILTELLRDTMHYEGVVITDALNMAGISEFFTPTQAVINTFKAGADIALMPIQVRYPQDIARLKQLIEDIAHAVNSGELDKAELAQSAARISTLKNDFWLSAAFTTQAKTLQIKAKDTLASAAHLEVEKQLAESAITLIKNYSKTLPISATKTSKIHLIMPDKNKCLAFIHFLNNQGKNNSSISCTSLIGLNEAQEKANILNADVIISANISPKQSVVEIGGMDDINQVMTHQNSAKASEQLEKLMILAKNANKSSIFISLRAPYDITRFGAYADAVLASYAYNVNISDDGKTITSAAFSALARAILGKSDITGQLPVTISQSSELVKR